MTVRLRLNVRHDEGSHDDFHRCWRERHGPLLRAYAATLLDAIRTTLVAEPVVGKARMVDERSQ